LHLDDGFSGTMLRGQSSFIQTTANHANDEIVSVGVLSTPCTNHAALAHDAYPIANAQYLSEFMSNDHHAVSLRRELAQRDTQIGDLGRRQHGGGLVQDKRASPPHERLENLNALLLSNGEA